jgi:hypothetical protein
MSSSIRENKSLVRSTYGRVKLVEYLKRPTSSERSVHASLGGLKYHLQQGGNLIAVFLTPLICWQ